jgi:hypothetical protein
MFDSSIIQVLVQSGCVGLCFYLIYVNRKINNGRMDQMLAIMNRNTEAMVSNAVVNQKLADKLDVLIAK